MQHSAPGGGSVQDRVCPWLRRHTLAIIDRSDLGPTWAAALGLVIGRGNGALPGG